jgi:predicted  nucleic acid-binding Zn-ribbon protein
MFVKLKGGLFMKCPKCGYNSFEYLHNCKKCSNSLDAFKDSLGLKPLTVEPVITGIVPGVKLCSELLPDQASTTEVADVSFQWDLPVTATTSVSASSEYEEFSLNLDESEPAPPSPAFSFDEEPSFSPEPAKAEAADESIFGDVSFDDSSSNLDPFATDSAETCNPFGEVAEPIINTSLDELNSLFSELETTDNKK